MIFILQRWIKHWGALRNEIPQWGSSPEQYRFWGGEQALQILHCDHAAMPSVDVLCVRDCLASLRAKTLREFNLKTT
jgi:hypothetical protein